MGPARRPHAPGPSRTDNPSADDCPGPEVLVLPAAPRRPAPGIRQPPKGDQAARRPADSLIGITAEQAIARGILVAGNPDTVYRQIMDIYDKVGGFGHFIFIGRSGFLDHREAEKGIRLMAKEVLPRLPAATATATARPAAAAE